MKSVQQVQKKLVYWMLSDIVKQQEKYMDVIFLDGKRNILKRPPLNKCKLHFLGVSVSFFLSFFLSYYS